MTEPRASGPGGPAPDEGPGGLPQISLPVHSLARYLRVRLAVTDGMVRWEVPRALLGIVPAGTRRVTVPVGEVLSVRMRRVGHPLRLLIGAAGVVTPIVLGVLWGGWWWALLPMIVVGLWVILVSLGPHLEALTRSGRPRRTGVCFTHQMDAEVYAAGVEDLARQARPAAPAL